MSSWCCKATHRLSRCSISTAAVLGAGWKSGKFLYVDTDLKIDLPEARVVLDREKIADLGLDLAGVGRELGTLLGGDYVNRFSFFDRSYKVIPQIASGGSRDGRALARPQDQDAGRSARACVNLHDIETTTAPRTLNRFQQRNAVRIFGGVQPGVTKEEGLRVLENAAAAAGGSRVRVDYAGESRQIRREGSALTVTLGFAVVLIYLVLAAQFRSFRDPLIVLFGSVPLAISGALVFSFLDLTTINIYSQVGLNHARRVDLEKWDPHRANSPTRCKPAASQRWPHCARPRSLACAPCS